MMDGQELRRRREMLGWSQAELGRRLGVSPSAVNRWERAKKGIRHPVMLALALEALQAEQVHAESLAWALQALTCRPDVIEEEEEDV